MSDFIERLNEEQRELNEKVDKLHAFLYSDKIDKASAYQQDLLRIQLYAMRTYLDILSTRINDLEK